MPSVLEKYPSIYEYILKEESAYRTTRVPLASNWRDWNMYEHIDRSFMLKNSRFYLGNQDYTRPFNNIILPIASVNYRSEGFDVKDVQLYVDNADEYHKSFIARKFHNWWAKENHINTAIDESVESYFDYGLVLVKNVNEARPEVVQLQQIAFCDQTDVMSGPLCLKHNFSISEILDFEGKWDKGNIDVAVLMAKTSKDVDSADGDEAKTPGKYIEVYELHGMFPESWLGAEKLGQEWEDTGKYAPQIHIVTYFVSPTDGKSKVGLTLFKGRELKPIFKALKRDSIHGRACGRGGIEELFHPQIWTNYASLHITQMLEAVSKIVLKTNKKSIVQLNNFSGIKQGQILDLGDDGRLEQMVIQPINKPAFDGFIEKWEQVARGIGSASDPQLGINPTSGTPLGTTEIVTSQGLGIHDYRQGKLAEFWQEIYRDWVLLHFQKEIVKGDSWLEDFSLDDLREIVNKISLNTKNKEIKKRLFDFNKPMMVKEEADQLEMLIKDTELRKGQKRFLEVIKGEFEDLAMDVEVNIVNKDKNMPEMVSKLNSLFRTLFTPGAIQAIQQDESLSGLLNDILESSGLSPLRFSSFTAKPQASGQKNQSLPEENVLPALA